MSQKQFVTLLSTTGTGTVADNAAAWVDVSEMQFPLAIIVSGSGAGDGIKIAVSNATTFTAGPAGSQGSWGPPAPTVLGTLIQAAITADGIFYINGPVGYVKASKPAATASSTVIMLARVRLS